jgi:hypothetical protein
VLKVGLLWVKRKEISGKFEIKPGYFMGLFRALLHIEIEGSERVEIP